ncbi:MAG: hypothetical protein HC892_22200 [Saprospiraceae bacterium]|nr:hypothetical protein [Saprospiraceae bacterium]
MQQALRTELCDEGNIELKATLSQVWIKKLTVPYDQALLTNLKETLWEVLAYYHKKNRALEEAITLMDAAQIANYCESFAEALKYINRAIGIFEPAEVPELLAQAHYRRALLLYIWAKNGNPQFFQGALDSFKETVKVFSRDYAPEVLRMFNNIWELFTLKCPMKN